MPRIGLLLIGSVLLSSACAHHPVPADCKTHLERINAIESDPQKDAAKVDDQVKEGTP
jgi:hypothetical protein